MLKKYKNNKKFPPLREKEETMNDNRNRNRGGGNPPKPHLAVKIVDTIFYGLNDKKEGVFEFTIVAEARKNRRPDADPLAGEKNILLVNELQVGPEDITDQLGVRRITVKHETQSKHVEVGVFLTENKTKCVSQPIPLPWPEKDTKKEAGAIRLAIVLTREENEILYTTVARLNENGVGVKGSITYVDADNKPQIEPTDEQGLAMVPLPLRDEKRKVIFFPSESPMKKRPVYVRGTEDTSSTTTGEPKKQTLTDFIQEAIAAFNEGDAWATKNLGKGANHEKSA